MAWGVPVIALGCKRGQSHLMVVIPATHCLNMMLLITLSDTQPAIAHDACCNPYNIAETCDMQTFPGVIKNVAHGNDKPQASHD
jgi:hypothetical protein